MGERKRRYEAHDGIARQVIYDPDEPDRFVVQTTSDLEPVLDSIARDRELMTNRGHNKHVARLPLFVVEDLIRRQIYYDEPAFKRWLNSAECDPWRIWRWRV